MIKKFLNSIKPLGGYVTCDAADLRYLTGRPFSVNEKNVLLVCKRGAFVFCAGISYGSVKKDLPRAKVILAANPAEGCAEFIKKNKISGLVFDRNKETFAAGEIFVSAGVAPANGVTAAARKIKSAGETALVRKACSISYRAYKYVKPRIKTGMTELEVAAMLENFMKARGADGLAFETITAFGENSAEPHHASGGRKLKKEDAVLIDFGCTYKGYCSDITRAWWHGKNAPEEYKKIWNLVGAAQKAALKNIKPGVTARAGDALCRDMISAGGYGDMIHTTGHGVGMNIHEAPSVSKRPGSEKEIFKEGMVFTVEPGIYLTGLFGVRLEETVVLSKKGTIILTKE